MDQAYCKAPSAWMSVSIYVSNELTSEQTNKNSDADECNNKPNKYTHTHINDIKHKQTTKQKHWISADSSWQTDDDF